MYPALSEEKRNEAALEFLDRVLTETGRFQLAMAKPMGLPPEPVRFYCFAAAGIPTTEYLTVDEENGEIAVAGTAAGDGKVSLRSAHFDYPQTSTPLVWQSVITLDGGHMGIMRSALFARNLAHVLICEP